MEVLSKNIRSIEPVHYRTMSEHTAANLRESIIRGNVLPGTKITESELAETLGVSRNVVREAVLMLTAEGMMIKERNRYTKVVEFTDEDIVGIFDLRTAVEKTALKRCIAKPGFCDALEAYSEKIEQAMNTPEKDYANLMYADIAFHNFIVESAGNRWLHDTWERIVGPMQMLLYKHMNDLQAMKSSHGNLIKIFREGDYQSVSNAIEHHIDDTLKELLRIH